MQQNYKFKWDICILEIKKEFSGNMKTGYSLQIDTSWWEEHRDVQKNLFYLKIFSKIL